MLGSFSVGVLQALRDEFGIGPQYFDVQCGVSCGAWNAAYWATNQFSEGIDIYTNQLPVGFIKGSSFNPKSDMRFLEWVARNSEDKLNTEALAAAGKVFIALTTPEQTTKFVCLNESKDPIEFLLKGSFVPGMAIPKKLLGEELYDGGLTCQPPIDFISSLHNHDDHEIWLVSPYPPGYRLNARKFKAASWLLGGFNPKTRKLIADCAVFENRNRTRIEESSLNIICPETDLPIDWRAKDKSDIQKTIELGKEAARKFMANRRTEL